jgi:hypothetical protein
MATGINAVLLAARQLLNNPASVRSIALTG